ncbi:MAG: hypothetical protein K2K81_08135 [Muribaculaceae bacterium]|nr:hypothetical protein [Muribaculaceae bacterium]
MKKILLISLILISAMTLNLHAENKTVVEGRYWNYAYVSNYERIELTRFHFKDKVRFNGKEYSIFRDKDDIEVAYLREENSQVFLYCGENTPTRLDINPSTAIVDDEIIVYDFNISENESFQATAFYGSSLYGGTIPQYAKILECNVTSVGFINNNNDFKQIDFKISEEKDLSSVYAIHYFIEGVGCTEGFLPFPCIDFLKTTSFRDMPVSISTVEDEQGNIIFDYGMLSKITTVTPNDRSSDEHPFFDLHGCEVSNPLPGSIYIRNGKKFVEK